MITDNSWFWNDNPLIYYYASSLNGLYQLTIPGNGSDFTVIDILEFYKSPDVSNPDSEIERFGKTYR